MNEINSDAATSASAAKAMLDSDVFNKCFEEMNSQIMTQILSTSLDAAAERERLYAMYKAGQLFVQQFVGLINNYEVDTHEQVV
jgi:hypothetical protein